MTRSAFASVFAVSLLLGGTTGPGLAQEGGWLGAELATVTGTSYNFATRESSSFSGSKVENLIAEGPAAAAGLKTGDERQAEDVQQLIAILRQMSPGSAVRVRVKRDDARLDVNVVLGKRPQGN